MKGSSGVLKLEGTFEAYPPVGMRLVEMMVSW